MWALVESNNVTQVYTRPKGLTIGEVNYPSNIFMLWTSSELEAIGIYEIVIDNSNFKNQEYYINTNQSFEFADGVVTASYGTATAKAIDDVTDEDMFTYLPSTAFSIKVGTKPTAAHYRVADATAFIDFLTLLSHAL